MAIERISTATDDEGKGKKPTPIKPVVTKRVAVAKAKAKVTAKAKAQAKPKTPTRKDFVNNDDVINIELYKFFQRTKRHPTLMELSKATGLSIPTIRTHWKKGDRQSIFAEQKHLIAGQAEMLFYYIMRSAADGKSRSQELAVQIGFDWAKPTHVIVDDANAIPTLPESEAEIDEIIANLTKYKNDISRLGSSST